MRKWLPGVSDVLKTSAHQLEKWASFVRWHIKRALRLNKPPRIMPYRGFGDGARWYLMGRVLEDKPLTAAKAADPWYRNAKATLRRFMTDEVPGVQVIATLGDQQLEEISDEEGYFRFQAEAANAEKIDHPTDWQEVELELRDDFPNVEDARATGFLRIPGPQVEFGVISDVDDTVIESHATSFIAMARTALIHNVHTRTPLAGVDRFYRQMERGASGTANNPFFFVSSSAWNLYDFIEEFLQVNDIPVGPILLRDLGIDDQKFIKSGHEHKFEKIERVMSFFSELPFVLVGDAGQDDPVIYQEVVRRHGDRIRAIYIRTVHSQQRNERAHKIAEETTSQGTPMLLVKDSDEAMQHAASLGLIAPQGEVAASTQTAPPASPPHH